MAEETIEEQGQEKKSEKIMCFVSKAMVDIDETIEIEYQGHKKVRVLPKYVKYDEQSA